jgi:hypothetical protein
VDKGNVGVAAIYGSVLLIAAAEGGWFALGAIAAVTVGIAAVLGVMAGIGWVIAADHRANRWLAARHDRRDRRR